MATRASAGHRNGRSLCIHATAYIKPSEDGKTATRDMGEKREKNK